MLDVSDVAEYRKTHGVPALAESVLLLAIKDTESSEPGHPQGKHGVMLPRGSGKDSDDRRLQRIEALAWLASRQAAPYFDIHGIDQLAALEGINWKHKARLILMDPLIERAPADHVETIRHTLDALGG